MSKELANQRSYWIYHTFSLLEERALIVIVLRNNVVLFDIALDSLILGLSDRDEATAIAASIVALH